MYKDETKESLISYINELEAKFDKLSHELTELNSNNPKRRDNRSATSSDTGSMNENEYAAIIENTPGALFLSRPDGTIIEANPNASSMFGYTQTEFKKIARKDIIDETAAGFKETLAKRTESGKVRAVLTAIKKGGEKIKVDALSVVFWDKMAAENRTTTILVDITESEKIKLALSESEKQYKDLFNLNPLPMWIYDSDTLCFMEVNQAAVQHYGFDRNDFLGMKITDLAAKAQPGELDNQKVSLPYSCYQKKDGTIIYVETKSEQIIYGGKSASLILAHDITDRILGEKKLAESIQWADLIFNNTTDLMFLMAVEPDDIFRCVKVNTAYLSFTGLRTEQLIGKTVWEVLPEEAAQAAMIHYHLALDEKRTIIYEEEVALPAGLVIVETKLTPVFDQDGKPLFLMGIARNILERKKTEQVIRDNERRMKNAQYVGGLGDWEFDCKTKEVSWSDELFRLFARNPEMGPPSFEEFIASYIPEDAARLKNAIEMSSKTGGNYELDLQLKMAGHQEFYHYTVGQVLRDSNGTIIKWYGIIQDITDRKQFEIKVNTERKLLRTLIDNLPDSIYVKDRLGRKIITNQVDMDLMHIDNEEDALGKTDLDIFNAELGVKGYADDMKVVKTGEGVYNVEESFIDKSGNTVWLLTTKVPMRDERGEITGILGIGRIITKRKLSEQALKESNERFTYVTQATSDAIWDWDLINNHLYWGDGYEKIFGYKIASGNKITSFNNIHPDDRPLVFDNINNLLKGKVANWSSEYRYKKADGEYAFVHDKGIIIRNMHGKAIRMIGAMQDITHRKLAEEAIARTQAKFNSLVNSIDGIVWESDIDSLNFSYVSSHAEKLLGYPISRWLDEPGFWATHMHPDDRISAIAFSDEHIGKKQNHKFEYRMITADGGVIWLADFVTVVQEEGVTDRLRGIMVDITDRKEAEKELVKERKLLRVLIDNLPDYIYVKDKYLNHIINNKASFLAMGFDSEEQSLGKSITEIFGDNEITQSYYEEDSRIIRTGEPLINKEEPFVNKDGEFKYLLTNKFPFRDDHDNIIGIIGISSDITERKNSEESLTEMNRQLKNLSNHLQHIREEERKHLAREVHDELGQLASVIKMDVDWLNLRLSDLGEAARKRIEHASATSQILINSIRKIASELRPGMIDELGLNASLEWQCKEFSIANGIPCEFTSYLNDESLSDKIKNELFRICQESLTNIMRHAQATQVTVSIQEKGEDIHLCIQDNGIGFDPLESRSKLGLVGMRERSLSINGSLVIKSEAGKGTTIFIIIPKN